MRFERFIHFSKKDDLATETISTRFYQNNIKPRITFMFDYGCSPLWLVDEEVGNEFGYNIDAFDKLGLSKPTIQLIEVNCAYYETKLNPVYQGYPSFWSGRMHIFFQLSIKALLENIKNEIGDKYTLEDHITNGLGKPIDPELVDNLVVNFVKDPVQYSKENGVNFQSEGNLRSEISEAYKTWVERETKFLPK
ncbi:MAG: hypothetical protein ACI9UJ_000547 [bacterium]